MPKPAARPNAAPAAAGPRLVAASAVQPQLQSGRRSQEYFDLKGSVFAALVETIDVAQLAKLDSEQAREGIREVVLDIIAAKKIVMSTAEQEGLLEDVCNDVLGLGPLEPLLARDEISDIMVNGPDQVFIEVGGRVLETEVRFRDGVQLLNICQRRAWTARRASEPCASAFRTCGSPSSPGRSGAATSFWRSPTA